MLFLALTLCAFPGIAQTAIISGQIRNATPGAVVEIFVPHHYLDGRDGHFRFGLDGQLRFSIDVVVPEPQLAFVIFNDDRLPVFLSKDDTLILKADAFQFPLAVSFSGKSAANNRLLQEFLHQNPLDFNEFNNIRFKIGQYWTVIEMSLNDRMENLQPIEFKAYLDSLKFVSIALYERSGSLFDQESGDKLNWITDDFAQWLTTEITYFWAYHLLVYGHVYGGRYNIQADFFDFLYEAPIINESIGSDWYRRFLLAFMARQEAKSGNGADDFWTGQYQRASKLLSGKALAFFRSEIISTAFSAENFRDLLPIYTDFMQTNEYVAFDEKVEGLYQRYAHVFPGTAAPTFRAMDANGNEISLLQLRGKVVYLNFWASWCGACLRKMEFMGNYESEFTANNIVIVNVSIDESPTNWRSALVEHQFKGQHLLASTGLGRNIAAVFGVEAIPQYFIIGRTGNFEEKAASNQPADIRQQLLIIAGRR
ncbi:MAG: TlpA family protein disulfide reductase [Saprospiraceae bacterium]